MVTINHKLFKMKKLIFSLAAIKKLKEAKELMDIEIITREEFNKLKEELAPIIKGN